MAIPRVQLLSNGRYHVCITERGRGYSGWRDVALTHWSGERFGAEGVALYLRDRDRGTAWSPAPYPLSAGGTPYEVTMPPGGVSCRCEHDDVATVLDVAVSPAADMEYRVLTVTNRGSRVRRVELTTYVEVALNHQKADTAHPVFSKLFVETVVPEVGVLLARRRPRSPEDPPWWMGHACWSERDEESAVEFETDRARFVGRGRDLRDPIALASHAPLSGTAGYVLDPMLGLRRVAELAPGATTRFVVLVAAGSSRDDVTASLTRAAALRHAALAREAESAARDQLAGAGLGAEPIDLPTLNGAIVFGAPPIDDGRDPFTPTGVSVADLAALGIAPDDAVVFADVSGRTDRGTLELAGRLVTWWRAMTLPARLVVLKGAETKDAPSFPPGTIVLNRDAVSDATARLITRTARLSLEHVAACRHPPSDIVLTVRGASHAAARADTDPAGRAASVGESLREWNGFGGFTDDGTEYVIRLESRDGRPVLPPRPWANVIANEQVGCLVTERGVATSWSINSRENRLTPWSNDPVSDPPAEALYLRDDDTGAFWSATPGPTPGPGTYEVHHGFGYTVWRASTSALTHETVTFVPPDDPVTLTRLRVTNTGPVARRISLYGFARWVLGDGAASSARYVETDDDEPARAILAVHPYRGALAGRVAFVCLAPLDPDHAAAPIEWTADRASFLGEEGELAAPSAVASGEPLDGRTGTGLDPCAAMRVALSLPAGASATVGFVLGEATDRATALALCRRYTDLPTLEAALTSAKREWTDRLGALQVQTPAAALDPLINGWLPYQTLSCRVWGRTAFYQSGGAYGFRDQLQDVTALLWFDPSLARTQILRNAAHQFPEGDVLHWWHPPDSRGIRTRFADDPLWLPFIATEYTQHTGDAAILDTPVPFIDADALEPGEAQAFLTPRTSSERASLYEHCCRGIDRSLVAGAHGLPLIGGGDWNDGMDRVGRGGRGESVWLGFFLAEVLQRFLPLCDARGDSARMRRYGARLRSLGPALEDAGWDGSWYRRAYYDDGTPMGSRTDDECRIDAIAQAWAVLSGAAPPDRARSALDAAERMLVDEDAGLIRLLTPPFDHTAHDPGYIKGYVPGVRENGGQYTHGVLWLIRAMAAFGDTERAARLLEMLSPIRHTTSPGAVATYQAEPYVVAADVYGEPPHRGRAGWTWYTGSSGWMFRVFVESILGLTMRSDRLEIQPCIPAEWPAFSVRMRLPSTRTTYAIAVSQPRPRPARTVATCDDAPLAIRDSAVHVPLTDDGATHHVTVALGADVGPRYRQRRAAATDPR